MRVGREVRVPLRGRVVLVPEQLPDVIERHPVLNKPGGGGVPHDPGREPADPGGDDRGIPDPVAEVPISHRAALRGGEHEGIPRDPAIRADMPSSVRGGTGDLRAQVSAALMGAVEAGRAAGLGVAGPMLRLAAEWERWVRHSPV
jgi:hypothetical protein